MRACVRQPASHIPVECGMAGADRDAKRPFRQGETPVVAGGVRGPAEERYRWCGPEYPWRRHRRLRL